MLRGVILRDWDKGGAYRVGIWHDLPGTFYPGRSYGWGDMGCGLHAAAPAVVDDFGNLAIVGGWS